MAGRTEFWKVCYFWRTDEFGVRLPDQDVITSFENAHYDSLDVDIAIEKSITSNADTATVTFHNHHILEQMYMEKLAFFQRINERYYDVDIFMYHNGILETEELRHQTTCLFTGAITDINVAGNSSINSSSVAFTLTAGGNTSLRTITNRKFAKGTTYRVVVNALLAQFTAYDATISDPNGKLNKVLTKARTFHTKTAEALDTICRDLEMTWGFDSIIAHQRTFDIQNSRKSIYFVDKESVFDHQNNPAAIKNVGVGPLDVDGATGKIGRVGYTKSQFTFDHMTDSALNIGRSVVVSDFGQIDFALDNDLAFLGRINRVSINNNTCHVEATYIDPDTGLAIVENDKKNTGAKVL